MGCVCLGFWYNPRGLVLETILECRGRLLKLEPKILNLRWELGPCLACLHLSLGPLFSNEFGAYAPRLASGQSYSRNARNLKCMASTEDWNLTI